MELELDEFVQDPNLGAYYVYLIKEKSQEIGRIVLRLGSIQDHYYDGHIGYAIKPEYRGHNKSFQACLLLKPIMLDLGLSEVVLSCDPANIPSKKIIVKLGGEYLEKAMIPSKQKKYFNPEEEEKEIYLWRLQ